MFCRTVRRVVRTSFSSWSALFIGRRICAKTMLCWHVNSWSSSSFVVWPNIKSTHHPLTHRLTLTLTRTHTSHKVVWLNWSRLASISIFFSQWLGWILKTDDSATLIYYVYLCSYILPTMWRKSQQQQTQVTTNNGIHTAIWFGLNTHVHRFSAQ